MEIAKDKKKPFMQPYTIIKYVLFMTLVQDIRAQEILPITLTMTISPRYSMIMHIT